MLLQSYKEKIFRPECNPSFQSLHGIAHLDQDVTAVLPYLNTVLGGFEYLKEPPAVTFEVHGKLITVHPRQIAINALKDEEADKILAWLKMEINETWEKRDHIGARFEGSPKPKILEILKLLPKTNCRECGQSTCMVFSVMAAEGIKGPEDRPPLTKGERQKLTDCMAQHCLES